MESKKILVVDDNRMIRSFLCKVLKKEGYEVYTASDGYMALKVILSEKPDVLFIDLFMPKIGGDLLCQMVRKMPDMDHSYLVIISAALAEMEFDYRSVGADACIAKGPFEQMARFVLSAVKDSESLKERKTGEAQPILGLGTDGETSVYPRRITKELLSRNRHLESILEGIHEGILELSGRSIIYANKHAETIFGEPKENLIARDFAAFFGPEDRWRIKSLLEYGKCENKQITAENPVGVNDKLLSIKAFLCDDKVASSIVLVNDVTETWCEFFGRYHERKLRDISVLTGRIAKVLNKRLAKDTPGSRSVDDSLNKEGITAPFSEQVSGLAGEIEAFSRDLSLLADNGREQRGGKRMPPPNGSETILVCDADPLALQFNRLMLEELGYQVIAAKSGMRAVAKFSVRHGKPFLDVDLVVTDADLPDYSMEELGEQLRRINPAVKIVTLTGGKKSGDTEDSSSGPFPRIQKPLDIVKTAFFLRRLLD